MFSVYVADNFHYAMGDEEYTHSEHPTWEQAVATAQGIVDDFLAQYFKPGMSAEALYGWYTMYGEDPFIIPRRDGERFSAWDYAKQRCELVCANRESEAKPAAKRPTAKKRKK